MWCIGSVAALAVAALLFIPEIEIRITEDQVHDTLDDHIPLSHDVGVAIIEVRDANVQFFGDGETGSVGLAAKISVDSFGLGGKGSADTISRLRYSRGAFYLTDMKLDDFEVKPTAATRVKLLAWKKAVETFLDDLGEDIRDREGEAAFEDFLTRRETIGPLLRDALDEALGDVPVYRLDNSVAQTAVWMALKDVRFENRVAVVTLTPVRLILMLAALLLVAVVGAVMLWTSLKEHRRNVERETY